MEKIFDRLIQICGCIILFFVMILFMVSIIVFLRKDDIISTDRMKRTGIISSVKYKPAQTRIHTINNGKVMTFVPVRTGAKYITRIEYDYIEYEIDNENIYNYTKDHVGEPIEVIFDVNHYKSGKSKIVLIDVLIE